MPHKPGLCVLAHKLLDLNGLVLFAHFVGGERL